MVLHPGRVSRHGPCRPDANTSVYSMDTTEAMGSREPSLPGMGRVGLLLLVCAERQIQRNARLPGANMALNHGSSLAVPH
ncbi:hypothetical protein BGLA2_260068 [Burkholderia gladioli]|nr:hypothetical protein BGLA2_260068 [Burkholderia gladioli]